MAKKAVNNTPKPLEPDHPRTRESFPIVGIGASAGGLQALRGLFAGLPANSDKAYVIVVHLLPDSESHLADLLQPFTAMPVQQIQQTIKIEKNCIYVIPPNANLEAIDTHLRLTDLESNSRQRAPVDHFFRTLARTHDGDATGIILSGTGADGTLGIKDLKEKGALTIVQDPRDAEYDGMPRSAISSAMVDLVLPLAEIPAAILRFSKLAPIADLRNDLASTRADAEQALQTLFGLLRTSTGRDFSHYKRNTLWRRLQRRIQLRQLDAFADYLTVLSEEPEEQKLLADDLLITVTRFFRDPDVFEFLAQEIIPRLFASKPPGSTLRVWSVGCATGEEAYSLAILLHEEAQRCGQAPHIQIFASDLHDHSLKQAREAFYPGDIDLDVSKERLQRYFVKERSGYRISKHLREMVVFAPHNLLSDPPFSHIDLLSCRNLLIYIQRQAQRKIIDLFHYSLSPHGYLVLGSSENLEATDVFQVLDKKCCVFRKRNVQPPEPLLPVFPRVKTIPPRTLPESRPEPEPMPYGELHMRIVERYAPPSLLLNPDDKVVHLSETAGRYLVHPGGEPTTNILRLVREELRVELFTKLQIARAHRKTLRTQPVAMAALGQNSVISMLITPSPEHEQEGFVLVVFEEWYEDEDHVDPSHANLARLTSKQSENALQKELDDTRRHLQAVVEEYETNREEMKASNEELQSMNEELRSTLEELETSKEELQSTNEELQTVNQENRHKVEELALLSDDLQNLLKATDIATLILNRNLCIMRFTPKVEDIFSIRATDRGRAISDLTHRLGYDHLVVDAHKVLDKLVPLQREVADQDGRHYLTSLRPYRSSSERIEGVVITFVDITLRKQAEDSIRAAKEFSEQIIAALPEPMLVLDANFTLKYANDALYALFRVSANQVIGQPLSKLGIERTKLTSLCSLLERLQTEQESFSGFETRCHFAEVGPRTLLINGRLVPTKQLLILSFNDITERFSAEAALQQSQELLKRELTAMQQLHELVAELLLKADLTSALHVVLDAAISLTGADLGTVHLFDLKQNRFDLIAQHGLSEKTARAFKQFTPEQMGLDPSHAQAQRILVKDRRDLGVSTKLAQAVDQAGICSLRITPLISRSKRLLGVLATYYCHSWEPSETDFRYLDLYARQAADFIEHVKQRELNEEADRRKDDFLAMLAHELRNPLAPINNGLELLGMSDDKAKTFTEIYPTLHRQVKQLVGLIDDLLEVSRISRGKFKLKKRNIALADVIQSAIEEVQPLIEQKRHEFTARLVAQSVVVYGDPFRLAQVFSNLLSNAVKYTPSGGRIELAMATTGAEVKVTISDTGEGIPADKLEQVFELFNQIGNSSKHTESGLGVGLALVKSFVEMHSGKVTARSAGCNKGSEFVVTLPVSAASVAALPIAEPRAGEEAPRRVLIVDDNEEAANLLKRLLDMFGHQVQVAHDGREAVFTAEAFGPELIFMDLSMPGLDGYAAAKQIRAQPWGKHIVLIALTGFGQSSDIRRTKDAGFNGHLVKPAELNAIKQIIAQL